MKKAITAFLMGIVILSANIVPVFAADSNIPPINPIDGETIYLPGANQKENSNTYVTKSLLPTLANLVVGLTGGLSLLFVIIGAIEMLTSFGNEDKLGNGKKTVGWALGGLLISILSYAIVQIVVSIQLK